MNAQVTISLDDIHAGLNPRRRFDNSALQALAESIRTQGVIQPVAVRPFRDGGYQLIAGERRVRAARMAGLSRIPAIVHDVDENEARLMALAENTARADMNPVEEAESLMRLIDALDGDRDEAARRLGWTRKKVDARLLLLKATSKVREALLEGKIKLGHAELLSQLPAETQDGTLEKLLEGGYSVAELKKRMEGISLKLSAACFDTSACQGCPHNSATQAGLFDEHIAAGRCANRACYIEKTRAALEAKKARLAETWPAVFLDTEKDARRAARLLADDVGGAQFAACQACANYGCLIRTGLDEAGVVEKGLCFDADCRAGKIRQWRESQSAKEDDKPAENAKAENTQKAKAPAPAAEKLPSKVRFELDARLRRKAAETISGNEVVLYAVYRLAKQSQSHADEIFQKFGIQKSLSVADFIHENASMDRKQVVALFTEIVRGIIAQKDESFTSAREREAADILAHYGVPLAEAIEVDAALLGKLPKNTLIQVLRDAGFDRHWEAGGKKRKFDTLAKKPIKDILKAFEESGFVFSSPPAVLVKHLERYRKS